ncbi:hypothetical protein SEA_JACKO_99 [Microbacterium phage Jacko]|nr:hypothetical protein SEA_JACKO_99 [Microbacterium phage Jacko]
MTASPADTRRAMIEGNRRRLTRWGEEAREAVEKARQVEREAWIALDNFEKANRPSYPTREMLEGIAAAAQKVHDHAIPDSHLGERVGGGVRVHGSQGAIYVYHGAPYGRAANGYLWGFTNSESEAIRDAIESHGLDIHYSWRHEKGLSFVTVVSDAVG